MARKPYPSDVTDEEWAFVAPYLTLMREQAPQREHGLTEERGQIEAKLRRCGQASLRPKDKGGAGSAIDSDQPLLCDL